MENSKISLENSSKNFLRISEKEKGNLVLATTNASKVVEIVVLDPELL